VLFTVERLDGLMRGIVVFHFDKSKSFAAARIALLDDLGAANRAKLGKHSFQH
jgi:hypothetical protein